MFRKSNDFVTQIGNIIQCENKANRQFLSKVLRINCYDQKPVSRGDFPEYSDGYYRQMVHRNKSRLELVIDSRPRFWKFKDVYLPGDVHRVTLHPMRVGDDMIRILKNLKEQPPKIHDIKIKFDSDLHYNLVKKGFRVNPSNLGILLKLDEFDSNTTIKILVYPKTVQVDIGCTYMPIMWDMSGTIHLLTLVGRLQQYLHTLTGNQSKIPLPSGWIITHYHFGKDGTEALSGKTFHRTVEEVAGGMIRFYSKEMKDKKRIARIEQIKTPNTTIDQHIDEMIMQETE